MSVAAIVKTAATEADVAAVPDSQVGELVGGDLYVSPRPAPRHAASSSHLGAVLVPPFGFGWGGGPGGWWILDEPELRLREDIVVPDLAGWRRSRMPALPQGPRFELAPDWICEVLSPSTERLDRVQKMRLYARERVGHLWLLNPDERTLEVFRLSGDFWSLLGVWSDGPARLEPFEALEFELSVLWGAPPPTPP